MQCPIDGTEMRKSQQEGIEIDYCPQCKGVWLDRGELGKIIDRTLAEFGGPGGPYDQQGPAEGYRDGSPGYERGGPGGPGGYYQGGPDGPGGYDRGGGSGDYRGGPMDQGYGGGADDRGGRGRWNDQGPGPGDDMGRGSGSGGQYQGPAQGERRRSIFDIFNF
jgi:uncharacterized protein